MEINEFIEKFAEIFDNTDASTLTPETNFHELEEWSSLSALGLIAMVDEEFEIELKGDEIRKANSIEDIYILISEKQ